MVAWPLLLGRALQWQEQVRRAGVRLVSRVRESILGISPSYVLSWAFVAPPPLQEHHRRGTERLQGVKDEGWWCGMLSSRQDLPIALTTWQKLWFPEQDRASQHSIMSRRGAHKSYLVKSYLQLMAKSRVIFLRWCRMYPLLNCLCSNKQSHIYAQKNNSD